MQQEEIDQAKGYRRYEDIWDFFDRCDKERAARPKIIKCTSWVGLQLARLWTAWLSPRSLYYKAYRFVQRRIRGFDDSEMWSLDTTILSFILPRLKRFKKVERASWPGPIALLGLDWEVYEKLSEAEQRELDEKSQEKWEEMLDKMIRSLELQLEHAGIFQKPNPNWKEGDHRRDQFIDSPEMKAEYEEGWALFIKWFHALWD